MNKKKLLKDYDFLVEYEKLCKKYKTQIMGCGCCDSPYLDEIGNIEYNKNKLSFDLQYWNEESQYITYSNIDLKKLKEIIENMEDN